MPLVCYAFRYIMIYMLHNRLKCAKNELLHTHRHTIEPVIYSFCYITDILIIGYRVNWVNKLQNRVISTFIIFFILCSRSRAPSGIVINRKGQGPYCWRYYSANVLFKAILYRILRTVFILQERECFSTRQ